jgi:D-alanine transaminase
MSIAYLNGNFIPMEEAKLPILDRGFLFADGVYEVIPVYNNKIFREEAYLKRLKTNLNTIYIDLHPALFPKIIKGLLQKNPFQLEQAIYLQVTRGVANVRSHEIPSIISPTVFGFCMLIPAQRKEVLRKGVAVITVEDIRWGRCDIKSINLLPNILMRQKAKEAGAEEALFVKEGFVFEGTSTNLFIVKNKIVMTPPLGRKVLGGITRELVIELAREHEIATMEKNITEEELSSADEVWLTSSTKGILPVTKIDTYPINNGLVGPLYLALRGYYEAYKNSLLQKPDVN